MLPQAARDFYARQQRVATTVRNESRRAWRLMTEDFDASWRRTAPVVLATVIEGQRQMAMAARDYVPTVLDATGVRDRPSAEIVPESLTAVASDGRPLDTLAYQAVVTAKVAVAEGQDPGAALEAGGTWLGVMAALQVADVARVAVGLGVTSRRNLTGYVRVLNPPVCQRCAVLGGRVYRWSQGFDRHPQDDCTMMPAESAGWAEAEGFVLDPMDAFRNGQIKDLTAAQAKAVKEGADLARVVNAYRGMSTTALETATSLAARRRMERAAAKAAERAARKPTTATEARLVADLNRLAAATKPVTFAPTPTPEAIYLAAKGNRDEAIRLLREHGYLT